MSPLPLLALSLLTQAGPQAPAPPQDPVAALESAVADAIARAEPSVVAITRVRPADASEETTAIRGRNPAPAPDPVIAPFAIANDPDASEPIALPGDYGSGVVIGDQGEILTTYHIVKGASRIRVRTAGRQRFDAEIIAADPRSDLAVIAPRPGHGANQPKLKPIALGDAGKLRKGSFLLVLGNPFNTARDGRASAGWGILANTARRIEPGAEERMLRKPTQFRHQPSLLQLDAKLNLGMSGGAVVNMKGELVGVTTTAGNADIYDAQAGYAIPMDALGRRVVESLKQGKEAEYGFLGISIDPAVSNRISNVRPGTPAAEGQLVSGDTIVGVGDRPIGEDDGLSLALSAVPPGAAVKLTVRHGDKLSERTLTMAKYPVIGPVIATTRPEAWRGVRVDFTSILAGATFTDDDAQKYANGGVGVIEVETGSPAEGAGLERGQVITEVDGKPVKTPAEFHKITAGRKGPVTLTTELGDEANKKIVVK